MRPTRSGPAGSGRRPSTTSSRWPTRTRSSDLSRQIAQWKTVDPSLQRIIPGLSIYQDDGRQDGHPESGPHPSPAQPLPPAGGPRQPVLLDGIPERPPGQRLPHGVLPHRSPGLTSRRNVRRDRREGAGGTLRRAASGTDAGNGDPPWRNEAERPRQTPPFPRRQESSVFVPQLSERVCEKSTRAGGHDLSGGSVKAEGLGDGSTHGQAAIAKLRLTLPPGEIGPSHTPSEGSVNPGPIENSPQTWTPERTTLSKRVCEKWHGHPAREALWHRHPADDTWAGSPCHEEPASHTPSNGDAGRPGTRSPGPTARRQRRCG